MNSNRKKLTSSEDQEVYEKRSGITRLGFLSLNRFKPSDKSDKKNYVPLLDDSGESSSHEITGKNPIYPDSVTDLSIKVRPGKRASSREDLEVLPTIGFKRY